MRSPAALVILPLVLAAPAAADDWQTLFDGKSLSAFRCYNQTDIPAGVWAIEADGSLKTVPGVKNGCDLITRDKYKDVDFELEWKVPAKGNSGIVYRVVEVPGKPSWNQGPEMQILDDVGHRDGLNATRSAGALYDLVAPAAAKTLSPAGQWNKSRIVIKGNHVEHWLNEKKIVEYEWGSPDVQKAIAASKFKDMPLFMKAAEGHIGIQHHGEEAWFRNIRVRKP
jgi:Domain of Unknown Function (DUF1080)